MVFFFKKKPKKTCFFWKSKIFLAPSAPGGFLSHKNMFFIILVKFPIHPDSQNSKTPRYFRKKFKFVKKNKKFSGPPIKCPSPPFMPHTIQVFLSKKKSRYMLIPMMAHKQEERMANAFKTLSQWQRQERSLTAQASSLSSSESEREAREGSLRERKRKVSLPAFSTPRFVRRLPYTCAMVENCRSRLPVEARQPFKRKATDTRDSGKPETFPAPHQVSGATEDCWNNLGRNGPERAKYRLRAAATSLPSSSQNSLALSTCSGVRWTPAKRWSKMFASKKNGQSKACLLRSTTRE